MTNGWTDSAVGGPGRRSTLGGGTCSTPLMVWSGGMSPGRADELLVWLSVLGEFLPVVVQRQALGWFSGQHESLFTRQSTVASGRISAFPARAVNTWKYGALFPLGFVSGSYTSCVWVLHEEYRKMNSPTILWLVAQCLARQ